MRPITLGLLGTAALSVALTAGVLLIRQPRETQTVGADQKTRTTHAGETKGGTISLDRIRALGY